MFMSDARMNNLLCYEIGLNINNHQLAYSSMLNDVGINLIGVDNEMWVAQNL